MHSKNIKRLVRKQLKQKYPHWSRLNRKIKIEISRKVLAQVVLDYDFNQDISVPKEELLAIEQQVPTAGILNLDQMADFVDTVSNNSIISLCDYRRSSRYIKNKELRFIDELVDDEIINRLLSYDGYSPVMRDIFLKNLLRAELLKAIKYPEISYRKFCSEEYFGLDRKQNRVFMGLSLREKTMIDHTQLCQFRKSLSFVQQVNLLVYFLHHFMKSGVLGENTLHAVDSTELANDCKFPIATLTIKGQKIRIYNDIDCDCGKRRNKRDKSVYVVGYRMHTLTVIDAETGHSFPLVSLLAPANHHDSHFLPFLVELAQAMGIELRLITADEAYHDKDGSLIEKTGVYVTTPPSSNVSTPDHVDTAIGAVFCHAECSIPMHHIGVEDQNHEYKCSASTGECYLQGTCPQYRFIPVDRGFFQRIPNDSDQAQQAIDIRKNCERPFNLLKNQTGLETVRVRSQHATMTRCTLSSIAVLLIEMAGTRRKKQSNAPSQLSLFPQEKAA